MTIQNKKVPVLRFPEFNGEWETKKLGDVGENIIGLTYSPKDVVNDESGVIVLRSSNIKDDSLSLSDLVRVISKISEKLKVKQNDILICTRNGSQRLIGKNIIIQGIETPMTFGAFMSIFRSEYNNFIVHLFKTDNYLEQIQANLGARINQITTKNLNAFKFNFPIIEEQQKIAAFLTAVDEKIQQLTKKKDLLDQYKKGVMQKIFNQEIRFKDDNGNDFADWEEKKLEDIETLVHGDGDWILSEDITENGQYKIIQLGNVGFGQYVDKKLKTISSERFSKLNCTPIKKGDLLINRMVDNHLYCCVFDKEGDYITSVDVCWIRKSEYLNNYFLMSLILITKNQNKLLNLSSGSGRVRISKKNLFEKFSFNLPSLKEQEKIASFLYAIDDKINLVNQQLKKTKKYKKGLLQQMFI